MSPEGPCWLLGVTCRLASSSDKQATAVQKDDLMKVDPMVCLAMSRVDSVVYSLGVRDVTTLEGTGPK